MNLLIPFLLLPLFSASALAQNNKPSTIEVDPTSDKIRLEAARELVTFLYKPERAEPGKEPTAEDVFPELQGDFLAEIQKMYEPVTDEAKERRDDVIARFLSRKLSAIESRAITDYLRTGVDIKISDIEIRVLHKTFKECTFGPDFSIDINKTVDHQKLDLARQFMDISPLTASHLAMLACSTVLMEYTLASELTIEELNTAVAFETSEAGRKYNEIIENIRYKN